MIPLYGRGSSKKDPREKKIPPRPQGQRSEQDYNSVSNIVDNILNFLKS